MCPKLVADGVDDEEVEALASLSLSLSLSEPNSLELMSDD